MASVRQYILDLKVEHEQAFICSVHEEPTIIALQADQKCARELHINAPKLFEGLQACGDRFRNGVILVHNHPSGNESASFMDRATTMVLALSLDLAGFPLLDHWIVTLQGEQSERVNVFSFALEHPGYLKPCAALIPDTAPKHIRQLLSWLVTEPWLEEGA